MQPTFFALSGVLRLHAVHPQLNERVVTLVLLFPSPLQDVTADNDEDYDEAYNTHRYPNDKFYRAFAHGRRVEYNETKVVRKAPFAYVNLKKKE